MPPDVQGNLGLEVFAAYAESNGDENWALNDYFNLFELPKNARILFFTVEHDNFGSSVVGRIGAASDDARYGSVTLASPSAKMVPCVNPHVQVGNFNLIRIKFEGANPTDNATIKVTAFYVIRTD